MSNIITVASLKKSYGNNLVLDNINLKIPEGSVVGLLGPNGCGKTTLLKDIANSIISSEQELRQELRQYL